MKTLPFSLIILFLLFQGCSYHVTYTTLLSTTGTTELKLSDIKDNISNLLKEKKFEIESVSDTTIETKIKKFNFDEAHGIRTDYYIRLIINLISIGNGEYNITIIPRGSHDNYTGYHEYDLPYTTTEEMIKGENPEIWAVWSNADALYLEVILGISTSCHLKSMAHNYGLTKT